MRILRKLYDFRPPHNVLCHESYLDSFEKVETKTQVANSLKEFIGDKMKLFITSCSLQSSQNFKGVLPHGFFIARCSHVATIRSSDCVEEMIRKNDGNERFILATADLELLRTLRKVPAAPIVCRIGDKFHFKGPTGDERRQARTRACPAEWLEVKLTMFAVHVRKETSFAELPE
ncbi:rRNA-processing protein UTP23 homolog isoform X1 [Tanacetum coccineum]